MFEHVVAGIDPGTAATGIAAVGLQGGRPVILTAETVRTPSGLADPLRLRIIHSAVAGLISDHGPSSVAIERLIWGRNVGSGMGVARASGVVLLAAGQAGLPVREYAPLEVKMAITGSGGARKEDVRRALLRLHRIEDVPSEADAADAVAVAVCDLFRSRMPAEARA
ncbi:MAG TPA: crossover junction endodeoxyribonuclease RuvC [Actinomycetota bacterium]|nr:crossover junction endodeoxyribonuclease RuvC [Actinomycetota bacterium]